MMGKPKPNNDLDTFKTAFSSVDRISVTETVCTETGAPLRRDIRPLTLTYRDQSITVDMPGWYGDVGTEGIYSGEDMKVSDRALNRLKARTEGLLEPEEIRRIRKT